MDALVALVREAGEEILGWYGAPGEVEDKEDRTPLTAADRVSHAQLVDPLDGPKEFLKGTGEFTVNVALIEEGLPVVGIVHVPALGSTCRASEDWGAQKAGVDGRFQSISSRGFDARAPVLVGSRDHAGPVVEQLATLLGSTMEFTSMGSSLKFCLVAEGRADLYLRDRPTMEWDTAAAQCIVERAGGGVFALDDSLVGTPLQYNKLTLCNPHFLCVGDPDGPWRELIRRTRPVKWRSEGVTH